MVVLVVVEVEVVMVVLANGGLDYLLNCLLESQRTHRRIAGSSTLATPQSSATR